MKAFFFLACFLLLLIFSKASALRGVAPCEARLHERRGAQRIHQGKAPAESGCPGTPSVGRGRSLRAELTSPGRRRLPGALLVLGEADCWIERRGPSGGKSCWPGTGQTGSWPRERGLGPGFGVRGPEKIQAWQRLGIGVSKDPGRALGSRTGYIGQARRIRPRFGTESLEGDSV